MKRAPVLAVLCPSCRRLAGAWCERPSQHGAFNLHASRKRLADEVSVAQHGETAAIVNTSLTSPTPLRLGLGIWRVGLAMRRTSGAAAVWAEPPAATRWAVSSPGLAGKAVRVVRQVRAQ